jgi:PAS domain S-box-containing protein
MTGPSEGILSVNPLISPEYREASRMVSWLNEAAFAFAPDTDRIVAWNRKAQDLLGYTEDQALILGFSALMGPDTASVTQMIPNAPVRQAIRAHDATLIPAVVSFSPLGEGTQDLMLAIVRPDEGIREHLFRNVFEQAATGIALTDLQGRFIECNEAFQKLVGFKQRELKHLTFNALSHPEDRIIDSPSFCDLLEGRKDYWEVTKRMIRKDGTLIWIHETVSLVKDGTGVPLYCIAIVNDITEERRAEQRADIQLTITKILADNPPANMALVQVMQAICKTLKWQIGEYWTPEEGDAGLRRQVSWQVPGFQAAEFNRFGQHVAMSAGEGLPGTVWSEGAPAWFADVRRESNFLRRTMAEKAGITGALAFPVTTAAGKLGVMVFAYRDFRQPDEGLLSMMTDFGSQLGQFLVRKQAERHLKLMGAIVNSSGTAIVGTDLDGLITSWNPSAERIFGYPAEEVVGTPCLRLFPGEHGAELAVALGQIRQGAASQRVELIARTRNGESQAVWVSPSRITDERGGTAGLSIAVYHAMTR